MILFSAVPISDSLRAELEGDGASIVEDVTIPEIPEEGGYLCASFEDPNQFRVFQSQEEARANGYQPLRRPYGLIPSEKRWKSYLSSLKNLLAAMSKTDDTDTDEVWDSVMVNLRRPEYPPLPLMEILRINPLILASASPRRRQLLTDAGYAIEVDPSAIDEPEPEAGTLVADYVANLAWRKATSVARRRKSGLILAADTACSVDGEVLNKPIDRGDAERMIRLQEGREIEVWTGLCLARADRGEWVGAVEVSICFCRVLTDPERRAYLDSGLWEGKAGAYGVQDDDPFVAMVRGSWSNVVGLPMERLAGLLREFPRLTSGLDSARMGALDTHAPRPEPDR